MLCSTHPDKEATGLCYGCNKSICPECSTPGAEPGTFYCFRCAAANEAIKDHLSKSPAVKAVGKKSRLGDLSPAFLIIIPLALIIIAVVLKLDPAQKLPVFAKDSKPVASAALIDKALKAYAADNRGRYPATLKELIGTKYLPGEFRPEHLSSYVYEVKPVSRESYSLKLAGDAASPEFRGGNFKK